MNADSQFPELLQKLGEEGLLELRAVIHVDLWDLFRLCPTIALTRGVTIDFPE